MKKKIKMVQDYLLEILPYQQRALAQIHRFGNDRPALLFRGEKIKGAAKGAKAKEPLVAKIADLIQACEIDRQIAFERERLALLRRRLSVSKKYSDWDIIALAQHHGIATRFLDWTSNSLVALFFALGRDDVGTSEVHILETVESDFQIPEDEMSPIPACKGSRTVIFTPQLIDSRIANQDSYLMRQVYEPYKVNGKKRLRILGVRQNPTFSGRVYKITIPKDKGIKKKLRDELCSYGYSDKRIFPDEDDWRELKRECDGLAKFYANRAESDNE